MKDLKVFRDPVYNLISFSKEEDKPVLELLDCPEVQRLKRIRQLGLSYFTFPSAVHDRFSHSLGVAYLIGLMVENLSPPQPVIISEAGEDISLSNDELKLLLQMTGLLHDIGHGPFSHAFERAVGIDHEEISQQIITDPNSQIHKTLCTIQNDTLARFAPKWIPEILEGTFPLFWVRDLISSQLDADRMDYLLRDAYMCGVSYVSFDRKWLLNNMELKEIPHEDGRLGLVVSAEKGLHALESFIISRYHMYEQVYFHKTTRGMEQLVIKIFERARSLQAQGTDLKLLDPALGRVFEKNHSIDDYLRLDDFIIICQIKFWQDHPDLILKELSRCFICRNPFKMFKEVKNQALLPPYLYRDLDSIMGGKEEGDFFFFEDDYINNPYKDEYLLGAGTALEAGHIWISGTDGQIRELAEESFLIQAMRNKSTRKTRGYVHRKYLDAIKEAI